MNIILIIEKFGIDNILKWKFETWNEPDLLEYNKLNFTQSGKLYESYWKET